MPELADWNRALSDWFLSPSNDGQPVYFSVDDDVLAQIADAEGWHLPSAVQDFQAALRQLGYRSKPFEEPFAAMLAWRRNGYVGDPPFIAALALTVLAAARMGSQKHARGRYSYYRPLGELLGTGAEGRPTDYDVHVPAMWRELQHWLCDIESGRRGVSTAVAPQDGAYCYIGWAVSQAVVRGSDRNTFVQFFTSIGARSGEDVPGDELLVRFERWGAAGRNRIGDRLVRALSDDGLRDVVAQSLRAELLRWDGSTHGDALRPSLPVYLAVKLGPRKSVSLLTRASVRLHDTPVTVAGSAVRLGGPGEWAVLPEELRNRVLSGLTPPECMTPDGRDVRLSIPREDCFVLLPHDELGHYVSAAASELGVEQCVLVRQELAAEAESAMARSGQEGRAVGIPGLPNGWRLYRGYVPQRRVEVPARLASLAPGTGAFPSLSGGLSLDSNSRVYLAGGAPDVVVPPGQPEAVSVVLDGEPLGQIAAAGGSMSLAGRAGAGEHTVLVGHRTMRFDVIEGLPRKSPIGQASLPGASAALQPRLEVRPSRQLLAIGDPPQRARIYPADPEWTTVTGLQTNTHEVSACLSALPFRASWLIRLVPRPRGPEEAHVFWVPERLSADTTPPRKAPMVAADPVGFSALMKRLGAAHVTVSGEHAARWSQWLSEASA